MTSGFHQIYIGRGVWLRVPRWFAMKVWLNIPGTSQCATYGGEKPTLIERTFGSHRSSGLARLFVERMIARGWRPPANEEPSDSGAS